jgi:hypothetical protein
MYVYIIADPQELSTKVEHFLHFADEFGGKWLKIRRFREGEKNEKNCYNVIILTNI